MQTNLLQIEGQMDTQGRRKGRVWVVIEKRRDILVLNTVDH